MDEPKCTVVEYRIERSEGGYAAKAGNEGSGVNYGAQTGKVNKPNWAVPRMRLHPDGASRLLFTRVQPSVSCPVALPMST